VLYYRLKLKDAEGDEDFSNVKTLYLGLNDHSVLNGVSLDGNLKVLSYMVRTPVRPEIEILQDVHPWPSSDIVTDTSEMRVDYKAKIKNKVKTIWEVTTKMVKNQ